MAKDDRVPRSIKEKARKISLLIMDVDGVLTPGYIAMNESGEEIKFFDVQDGFGLILWKKAGLNSAIITAGETGAVRKRAVSLKIDSLYQKVTDKLSVYEKLKKIFKVGDKQVCFIGDDLIDLPILKKAGFACCVSNAHEDIKARAHYISRKEGGRGAVREIIDLILKSKGLWRDAVRAYL